NLR
ncbi:hypothetical protein FOXB_03060, partial [Fusarium oxysporum f. sp. conglutinans Fo5176]